MRNKDIGENTATESRDFLLYYSFTSSLPVVHYISKAAHLLLLISSSPTYNFGNKQDTCKI